MPNRINLVCEENKCIKSGSEVKVNRFNATPHRDGDYHNRTYTSAVAENARKTQVDSYTQNHLASREKAVKQNSSPFLNPLCECEAERLKKNVNVDTSQFLISNIKNVYKKNTDSVHSRDSEFKNKTKDSQEYSYGADVQKMEPKINEYPQGNLAVLRGSQCIIGLTVV